MDATQSLAYGACTVCIVLLRYMMRQWSVSAGGGCARPGASQIGRGAGQLFVGAHDLRLVVNIAVATDRVRWCAVPWSLTRRVASFEEQRRGRSWAESTRIAGNATFVTRMCIVSCCYLSRPFSISAKLHALGSSIESLVLHDWITVLFHEMRRRDNKNARPCQL
jgi:hypothetical protein